MLRKFMRVEDGLVTVEWVALTAGMVVAAVAIGFVVMSNTAQEAANVGGEVVTQSDTVYGPNGENLLKQ
jgi:hypothetical protein